MHGFILVPCSVHVFSFDSHFGCVFYSLALKECYRVCVWGHGKVHNYFVGVWWPHSFLVALQLIRGVSLFHFEVDDVSMYFVLFIFCFGYLRAEGSTKYYSLVHEEGDLLHAKGIRSGSRGARSDIIMCFFFILNGSFVSKCA